MNEYSPYLALFTGFLEIFAFIYFIQIFKQSEKHLKSMIFILLFLGTYQLLEAFNCMYPGHHILVRMSFATVTVLPALGVAFNYLSSPNESKNQRYLTFAFMGAALFFITYFIITPSSTKLLSCQQFFATYHHTGELYRYFGMYYQFGLLAMLIMGVRNLVQTQDLNKRMLIGDYLIGSIVFIVPSILITGFIPNYQGSMTSVMCHIAIFFSFFIIQALYREKKIRQVSLDFEVLTSSVEE